MNTQLTTIQPVAKACQFCGKTGEPLTHIGNGFIVCADATECLIRGKEAEIAYLNAHRAEKIRELKVLKEKAGMPDTALETHRQLLAEMIAGEGDEQC